MTANTPIETPAPSRRVRLFRRAKRAGIWLGVVYLLGMTFGCPADRLLLIPQKSAERVFDAKAFSVPFRGGSVEVFTARSPGAPQVGTGEPEAYVLEFTGNGSRADDMTGWVASRWGARSVEAWVMNYPGYGRSTGPARLATIGPAGLAVFDDLVKRAGGRPIYVAGNSMGTTVALHVAANRPGVAGLILQSPPPLRQVVLSDHGWWNLWLLAGPVAMGVPSSLDSVAQASGVYVPAIFITADRDALVRPAMQKKVIDAYAGPKRLITLVGKGHNDSLETRGEMREYAAALDWLTSTAGQKRAASLVKP